MGELQGTVKKVDPAAGTVQVSRLLGLLSHTLQVTGDTHITVDGRHASLPDIREGSTVKAIYEIQNGQDVAKAIEVILPVQPENRSSRAIKETPGAAIGTRY